MTAPRTPTDRLGKLPRRVTVGIYLDDQLATVHDAAVAALEAARTRLETERARRIAAGKTAADIDVAGDRQAIAAAVLEQVAAGIDAELAPLQAAVDEALTALDAATVWFTFRALGRKRWQALKDKHPATDEDNAAAVAEQGEGARAQWNALTLAPELVQVASVGRMTDGRQHGQLTAADVTEIFEGEAWSDPEINALYVTALVAQTQGRAVTHRAVPAAAALELAG